MFCSMSSKPSATGTADTGQACNQVATCGGTIPTNATATTATTYTQTWNGSIWTPTTSWTYSASTCGY